jgi:hypothetical protein
MPIMTSARFVAVLVALDLVALDLVALDLDEASPSSTRFNWGAVWSTR